MHFLLAIIVHITHVPCMRLRAYLRLHGLSELAFAEQIGVASTTINRLVRGKTRPSFDLVQRIYEATQGAITPNDLFDIAHEKTASGNPVKGQGGRKRLGKLPSQLRRHSQK
ncbi:MAG: helix-turn-helix transcriptional regulator [Alphaproteobacteria bacterium]